MCEMREYVRYEIVMKRILGMMMMNVLISYNYIVSGCVLFMNYVYGLNFVNFEL